MRVVLTGGTGFIGRRLVEILYPMCSRVLLLVRDSSGIRRDLLDTDAVDVVRCDLSDKNMISQAVDHFQPDIAVHLAWEGIPNFSLEYCLANIKLSVNFIDAVTQVASCRRVLVTGTCLEYGEVARLCDESQGVITSSQFTWAKNAIHDFLKFACCQRNIDYGWFRLFYVYGPGQREGSLIPSVLKSLRECSSFPLLGNPSGSNDYVFVDDVVELLTIALRSSHFESGVYNVGSGRLTSVAEVCEQILDKCCNIYDRLLECGSLPEPSATRPGITAGLSKTEAVFGWRPLIDINSGIQKTVDAYFSQDSREI